MSATEKPKLKRNRLTVAHVLRLTHSYRCVCVWCNCDVWKGLWLQQRPGTVWSVWLQWKTHSELSRLLLWRWENEWECPVHWIIKGEKKSISRPGNSSTHREAQQHWVTWENYAAVGGEEGSERCRNERQESTWEDCARQMGEQREGTNEARD